MRLSRFGITFLMVVALGAFSFAPAMAANLAYFGGKTGGGGTASIHKWDPSTNTVTTVESALDEVTALDVSVAHVYAGLDITSSGSPSGNWIYKRYTHAGAVGEDIQFLAGPIEDVAVSATRSYVATGDGGGLIKSYPNSAPFTGGGPACTVTDCDLEVGRGAGIQIDLTSDGNILYASMQNAGGGLYKRYDVSSPFAFPNAGNGGQDIELLLSTGTSTLNFVVDEAAPSNGGSGGRLVIGPQDVPGTGSLIKTYDHGAIGDPVNGQDYEIFGVASGWPTLVESNGAEAFVADSIAGGIIKQYTHGAPEGGGPSDIYVGAASGNIFVGGLKYLNGKLYALVDRPGDNSYLWSFTTDGTPNPGPPLNMTNVLTGTGQPEMLEKSGNLLFIGASANGGTFTVYDTISETVIHQSTGYGNFTAFAANIPEPGSLLLASIGLVGLLARGRRK